jgi:hypothetical protein
MRRFIQIFYNYITIMLIIFLAVISVSSFLSSKLDREQFTATLGIFVVVGFIYIASGLQL